MAGGVMAGAERPRTIGGTIAVADSGALALQDPSGLPIGSEIWNADVGAFFKLTISSAGLVADEIVAVLGTDGSRWIIVADGSTAVQSVTGPAVDDTDPQNPTVSVVVTADTDGLMSFEDKIKLDEIEVQDEITVTVAGAAATKITVPGLVGATDGNYEIRGHITCTGAFAGKITFKPNDVATSQACGGSSIAAAVVTPFSDTVLVICEPGGATGTFDFLARFESKSGKTRLFVCNAMFGAVPTWSTGQWNSGATEISSLVVQSSNAGAIDIGSYVTVRKLKETT